MIDDLNVRKLEQDRPVNWDDYLRFGRPSSRAAQPTGRPGGVGLNVASNPQTKSMIPQAKLLVPGQQPQKPPTFTGPNILPPLTAQPSQQHAQQTSTKPPENTALTLPHPTQATTTNRNPSSLVQPRMNASPNNFHLTSVSPQSGAQL